jgi:uncharacterized protein YqcC (DUF446 family)
VVLFATHRLRIPYAAPVIGPEDVRPRLAAVVAAMKQSGAWEVARPEDAALADMGAFGGKTMAFEQWLRWIFVPNVEGLIASAGPWPEASQVAAVAMREGDTNPAVAALVDALAAFDAVFCDDAGHENQAGWTLVSKRGHSREDLEAAVACFRRSIQREPEVTQAAANLGTALVELGREGDAITELERVAAGEGAIAAAAHNWLGWRLMERDRDRALVHLHEATRLRPAWGVAWQNLARALDAAGDLAGACRAYSEAIACGDAHDDAFARDRRLQLEMQLLARGEPVPAVPDVVRADSAAFAIVRAAAARCAMPHVFMVRPTTRDMAYAIVGTVVEGRALGHAIVGAAADWLAATTLARAGDLIVFESTRATAAEAEPAAGPLVAWLAALDPAELTPLDAAMYLRDTVLAKLPVRWTWELASYRPAALVVMDPAGEVRVAAKARPGGGVEIALSPIGAGSESETLVAEAPARLLELAPAIEDATRRAVAARDGFASRPFGIRVVAAQLAGALGLGKSWLIERYPAWPTGGLYDATDSFAVVHLVESATGFAITVGRERFTAGSTAELAAVMPALTAAVAADLTCVRVDRIKPQDRFRVRATFGCFSPGSEIELERVAIISRDGERAYTFASVRGSARTELDELDDAHAAMLADLDRYLQPA